MSENSITEALSQVAQIKNSAQSRLSANKDRIKECLKSLHATHVVVNYSGSGDCGQIDDVFIYKGDSSLEPEISISVLTSTSRWDNEKSTWIDTDQEKSVSIEEAIEDFVYDWLSSVEAGWEINDGSSGKCTIEVENGEFLLNHTSYYIESDTTEHSL